MRSSQQRRRSSSFVAIDFETANYRRDSACAVGIVICNDGQLVDSQQFLIRPTTREFVFTYIHGLTWHDVAQAPSFGELWPTLNTCLGQADFLAAHNAPFDRGVLRRCCQNHGVPMPAIPFHCTVGLARRQWGIYPTRLPDVCRYLDIPLRHHDAKSDAEACARIVLAALDAGWVP